MKKFALYGVLGLALVLAGLAASVALGGNGYGHVISTITQTTGGGHTPVTICHKPGTPAEQELVVDDDSVELTGHLGHGDTIGPCPTETTPTDTTPTDTTPTDTTPTTPTETTPTTPHPQCPPGLFPYAGKDGQPGNDECCPDANGDHVCDVTTPPTETTRTEPPATLTTESTTAPPAAPPKPLAKPKHEAAVRKPVAHKPDKPVELTGNPKTDKCKDLGNGTMRCKGVVVTQGNG